MVSRLANKQLGSRRRASGVAAIAAAAFLVTGCMGGSDQGADAAGGEGYAYGASEEEIKAAFADIEPVNLVYQPSSQSAKDFAAPREIEFAENIEKLSDGKVTVEIVYGQAIAPFPEVPQALADGRLDIASFPPIYMPEEFPKFNNLLTATTMLGSSPLVGELAATAAITETWWNSPEVLEELRAESLHVILPVEPAGQQVAGCESDHVSESDWSGALGRGSSEVHMAQLEALGATPVSVEAGEVFEGLQRNMFDCVIFPFVGFDLFGLDEVAPSISYLSEVSFNRGPNAFLGGAKFDSLPLAVRQLVFDQGAALYANSRYGDLDAAAEVIQATRENGGLNEISPDLQKSLYDASTDLINEQVANGELPENTVEDLRSSYDKWLEVAKDLGYEDEGTFEEFDQWYERDDVDLMPFATELFEEVFLEHRPTE